MRPAARLGAAVLVLLAVPAAGAVPPCRVEVTLEPERAVVGQQVLYRLRIERRHDVARMRWERNLSFPAFRAEWLPGRIGDDTLRRDGDRVHVYEERRALFPVRAGRLRVPPAGLLCGGPGEESLATIPAVELLVVPAPEAGRPDDWSGVVGPVEVTLTAPRRIALGESLRVAVQVRGPANLWDVDLGVEEALAAPDVEVFPRGGELARDAGRRLSLRLYESFDVVPRGPGTLEIPALHVPWLDPATGRYARASTRALRVVVEEPPALRGEAPPAEAFAREGPAAPAADDPSVAPWAPAAVAALVAVTAGAVLAWRRRRRDRPADAIPQLLDEAAAAERRGDAEAAAARLARALRTELSRRVDGAHALATEELLARAPDGDARTLAELLGRLDRARFAPGGSRDEIRAVLAALRARVRA